MTERTVHVALYDTFADWEVGFVTAHLQRPLWRADPGSIQVRYVGATLDPVTTMGNMTVVPDLELAELDPADSAMLVLAGSETWESGALAEWGRTARRFLDAGTPVAAICGATYGMAVEGLLDGRDHTSGDASYLAMSGYAGGDRYREADAVSDGGLITAAPTDPVAFAREVFTLLGSHASSTVGSWFKLFGEHDRAGFFELTQA